MKKVCLLAGSLSLLGLSALPAKAVSTSEQLPVEAQSVDVSPVTAEQDELLLADQSLSQTTSVNDLMAETKEDSVGQVTSVSQLSDVQPDDWAFQAIQSLVERYGCVAGYPNGTFRPSRAMSRREAAALVNACLDNLSNRFATKEDLDALKALQDEFAAELATLRGRVDGLEARVATVEAQQFSTTTKLQGEVVMAAQFGDFVNNPTDTVVDPANGVLNAGGPDSRVSAISRVRLNFNTSFSGDDLLATQLEVGNNGQDFFGNALGAQDHGPGLGTLTGSGVPLVDLGAADYAGVGNTVTLRRLAYTFKPGENLAVTVGTNIFPSDFVDFNSYANNSAQDFSSGFFINNPLIITNAVDLNGGAGAAFDWNPNAGNISVRGVYVAAAGNVATAAANGGLGGDPHQGTLELEYANSFGEDDQNNFAIRLQGTYAETFSIEQKVLGVNAEATFGNIGVFGRYGISFDPQNQVGVNNVDVFGAAAPASIITAGGSNTIQTWMAGVGYKDALVPGSLFAVAAGMPYLVTGTPGSNDQINLEAFYRFPVNDNITITPAVMYIINPLGTVNGLSAAGAGNDNDIIQGLIRATFSF
ncbi:iron uptake porin [Acaryochloris marina]|uniref:Carbohydrate-selective porin OprB family n=1 Tax=Acaryochloris marina (strain MBIC 11017) TaxID=329726 RepID=B0C9F3_ACAM1|nr:iron uptake porin [Acaryochloris marina]ABW28966.1 carbohydrate-selective porin OprB family [Acaryochloris marina MBIC11017]BDM77938.1 porin [Acaryochloris marina MBIC10699]